MTFCVSLFGFPVFGKTGDLFQVFKRNKTRGGRPVLTADTAKPPMNAAENPARSMSLADRESEHPGFQGVLPGFFSNSKAASFLFSLSQGFSTISPAVLSTCTGLSKY
jgi:hypothetical protein